MRVWLSALLLTLTACSPAAATGDADLILDEFQIVAGDLGLRPGATVLSAENRGEFGHTVVIADETGHVVAASELIPPGETGTVAAELQAGTYEFTCRIVFQTDEGSVVDHYEEGMRATVTVTPAPTT